MVSRLKLCIERPLEVEPFLLLILASAIGLAAFILLGKKNGPEVDGTLTAYQTINNLVEPGVTQPLSTEPVENLLNEATSAITSHNWEQAIELLTQCLRKNESNPEIHRKLAQVFIATEAFSDACEAYSRVVELIPEDWATWEGLMTLYLDQDNLEETLQVADHLLTHDPNHLEASFAKIQVHIKKQDPEPAILWLEGFLGLTDSSKPNTGKIAADKKRAAQSYLAEAYRQAYRLNDAAKLLEELIVGESNLPTKQAYQFALAELLMALKRYEQAVSVLKDLIQGAGPDALSQNALKETMVLALLNLGRQAIDNAESEEAVSLLMDALSYQPKHDRVYFYLGKAYKQLKRLSAAQESFNEAALINPQEAEYQLELAYVYEQLNQVDYSLRHYEECLRLKPDSAQAAFGAGTCWGLKENYAKAIYCLKKATELSPNFIDALYNLAVAHENVEQYDKALDLYKRVLGLDSGHIEAKSNLAHLKKNKKLGLFK